MSDIGSPLQEGDDIDVDVDVNVVGHPDVTENYNDNDDDHSDVLSEIDEDQFDDYDPTTADIKDRPVAIDADAAQSLKASKRKRTAGADVTDRAKKTPRRREKRPRGEAEADNDVEEADDFETGGPKKQRRRRVGAAPKNTEDGGRAKKSVSAEPNEDESLLTPEERRRREISRALDAAGAMTKKPIKRRKKKDDIDLLEDQIDEELSDLKVRMEEACQADNLALQNGQPALQKLKLLPEVTAMLSRQNAQDAILDPEINFLQHVRFFLEPLQNGTLPAYTIQRDLFTALTRLPVQKEALISSKVGGLVLFYTRSRQPEVGVKRMAERLVEEWSRPILNKTDDWSKRQIETRYFDAESAKRATVPGSQVSLARRPAAPQSVRDIERERILAPSAPSRFRPTELPATYTVAPKSTFQPGMARTTDHRPIGAGGIEAFRRMTQKSKKR